MVTFLFGYLFVCFIQALHRFQQPFSHIATVSGCCRKPNAQFNTKTRLFKYTENFTTQKREYFQIKNSDIFHISD